MQLHGTLKQMVDPHMWDIHIVQTSWHLHLKNILWISMLDHFIYFEHILFTIKYVVDHVFIYVTRCVFLSLPSKLLLASSYKLLEHHINVTYNCTIEYDTKCNTIFDIWGYHTCSHYKSGFQFNDLRVGESTLQWLPLGHFSIRY